MAANKFDVPFRTVALTAAVAKTVVGVKASTNVALELIEACASFDGATSSNAPAVVDFNRCTFATNSPGTNSTSLTLGNTKRDPGRAETIQATGAHTWSAEPTVLTAQHSKDIGQFNGLYHYINPFSAPHIIVGGQGFVITCSSPNNVNATGHLTCVE
jgi:hypothetical protein